ncbi:hypothetical protein T440DRAFT_310525 [Plenodomus tracheiphilus IPT5]|uniref:Uncharacterized protein n=1 Tax=Plenodomus tracheiphilus IPT5 TaxID=1408161 RepID=A0A6A7BDJ1_9PLEO|nr:hypothetical protein T440DRAFT_310525 [Plenodomus tracheiphilus IPT5]
MVRRTTQRRSTTTSAPFAYSIMTSHSPFDDALSRLGNHQRSTVKRKARTFTYEPVTKRRKWDLNRTQEVNENDDINDFVERSLWPLCRSQIRSPQHLFDADDSSDEDNSNEVKDHITRGVAVKDGIHRETTLDRFSSKGAHCNIVEERGSSSYQSLTSQLAEEEQICKRNPVPVQQSQSIETKQQIVHITNKSVYRAASTLHASYLSLWDDEEQTVVSSPVNNTTGWSLDGNESETKATFPSIAAYENPSCTATAHDTCSFGPANSQTTASETWACNVTSTGLGFPLDLFRNAFEEDRMRKRMRDLRVRMSELTLLDVRR